MLMKTQVISEKQNPHMKRKELTIAIDHISESTPSKAALEAFIIKHLSTDKDRIEILDIMSKRGIGHSLSRILIWDEPRPKKEEKVVEPKPAEA